MSQTPKEFEEIDKFLALARTVDNFKNFQTVYELFGITEPNAPYTSIEASINDFVGNYQASAHVPKYKSFVVELQKNIDMIKRVLGDDVRDEYNNYLRENDPKIANLKGKFDFATDNGTLSSDDEDKLIESGRNDGLDEDECVSFIDRWMKENGVCKVDSTSSSTSSSSFDKLLGLTFYEILGVPESANQAQIEEKYKEKYRENQKIRDKKRADGEWAIITAAYNRLRDPAERIKYDRELHNPSPPGTPVLMVVRGPKYVFKNVKKGSSESARIVIKNSGGGLLQGTITSDASWLEPGRNKLLDIHEQELYINIFTSKIPPRTYKVAGNVTIDTNAGKEIIPFEVFLESYDDELLRLKQYYVPMLAALGGLIFSFHYQMLGLVIAGISLWIIGAFAAKPLLDIILNQRINLGKIPTPAVRVVSIGIVVLAVWLQYYNSQPIYGPRVTDKVSPPLTSSAIPTPKSKPYLQGNSGSASNSKPPDTTQTNTTQRIGSQAAWNPPGGEGTWREIHEKCWGKSDILDVSCIESMMRKMGASEEAIKFTKLMRSRQKSNSDAVYMSEFREMGKVDLAQITAPVWNHPDTTEFILVNGVPEIVQLWDNVKNMDITKDGIYPSLVKRFPKIEMWITHEFVGMQQLQQKGQRFVFSFTLLNGCHACDLSGKAEIAFDFDSSGKFLGTKLVRLVAPEAVVTSRGNFREGLTVPEYEKQVKEKDPPSVRKNVPPPAKVPTDRPANSSISARIGPQGRYMDNHDGTVTDSGTSLMWMRCAIGQSWTGSACKGNAKVVTWDEAIKYSIKFAGYDNWRLPNIDELASIIYCSNGKPDYFTNGKNANNETGDWGCYGKPVKDHDRPTLSHEVFPNCPSSLFWSSSRDVVFPGPYGIFFGFGSVSNANGTGFTHIRMVRNGK